MPPPRRPHAFTLVELLVSMTVLLLLVALVAQLFNSALNVTSMNGRLMDADEQARVLFDRMAIDFARMVKRADVDYYVKQSQASPVNKMPGNDQIAFYSEVPGYYSPSGSVASGTQSPVSLVAYRVNSDATSGNYQKVERLGKGLVWNGAAGATAGGPLPVFFLPVPLAAPLASPLPSPMPSVAPTPAWPQAGNNTADPDYELLGPQVFRLEYYYLLKGQTVGGTNYPSVLSDTPWDARIPGHVSTAGMQDVAAVGVAIAVLDPQSHALASDTQVNALAAQLGDFVSLSAPGTLEAGWQSTVNAAISAGQASFPASAAKWVRIYHRYFYLNLPQ